MPTIADGGDAEVTIAPGDDDSITVRVDTAPISRGDVVGVDLKGAVTLGGKRVSLEPLEFVYR